jgi:transposase-like protein
MGGRPFKIDDRQQQMAIKLYNDQTPIKDILTTMRISRSTLYNYIHKSKVAAP